MLQGRSRFGSSASRGCAKWGFCASKSIARRCPAAQDTRLVPHHAPMNPHTDRRRRRLLPLPLAGPLAIIAGALAVLLVAGRELFSAAHDYVAAGQGRPPGPRGPPLPAPAGSLVVRA